MADPNKDVSTLKTKDMSRSSKIAIGDAVGRFLSNFSYVLGTLGLYLFLSAVTFIWLAIDVDRYRAATITYDVATGGNPLEYIGELQRPYPVLWGWIVFFHILAWLVVPVLAATAVDAAYRKWDERKEEAERRLRKIFRIVGRDQLKLSGSQLEEFEDTWIDAMREIRKGRNTSTDVRDR